MKFQMKLIRQNNDDTNIIIYLLFIIYHLFHYSFIVICPHTED